MAASSAKAVVDPEEYFDPDGLIELEDTPEEEGLDPVRDLLDTLGDDARDGMVRVYRNERAPNGQRTEVMLFETKPEMWGGWVDVQTRYGGGDYQLKVWGRKEVVRNGVRGKRMGLLRNRQEVIASPLGGVKLPDAPAVASAQAAPAVDIPALLREMNEANRQANMEMMRAMAEMFTRAQPPAPTEDDFLRRLAVTRTLFVQPPPATPHREKSFVEQLKELTEVNTLLKGVVGGGDVVEGEPGILTLGSKLLDVLVAGGLINPQVSQPAPQALPRPQQRVNPAPAPGAPPQRPANPVAVPEAPPGEDQMLVLVKAWLAKLITLAAANADPYVYAVATLDEFGADAAEQFVLADDWWDALMMINAGVAPHRAWFDEMRAEMVDLLQGDEEEGTEGPATPPGPAPNVSAPADPDDGNAPGTA